MYEHLTKWLRPTRAAGLGASLLVAFTPACGDDTSSSSGPSGTGADGTTGGGGATSGGAGGMSSTTGTGANATTTTTGTGGVVADYPPGPYGVEEGDVIANLQWEGYANENHIGEASAQPFIEYSANSLRTSGKTYALLHFAAVF